MVFLHSVVVCSLCVVVLSFPVFMYCSLEFFVCVVFGLSLDVVCYLHICVSVVMCRVCLAISQKSLVIVCLVLCVLNTLLGQGIPACLDGLAIFLFYACSRKHANI